MVKNDIFTFLLLELMLADLSPPVEACSGQEWHFHILHLELILADQLAYLPLGRGI